MVVDSKEYNSSWRSESSQELLKYFLERLSKTAPVAATSPDMWKFDLSPLYELYEYGAYGTYLQILVEGREASALEDFLEMSAIRGAKAMLTTGLARDAAKSSARARLYMIIVEDKFGVGYIFTCQLK